MKNISIVLLHYENLKDTEECLRSLKIQREPRFSTIVVDNGSPNGKITEAFQKADFSEGVHFLRSEKNLGFAKGNNLGFTYAKESLHAEIIVLANNDLLFKDPEFTAKLSACYEKEPFDVAGPKIISLVDGMNQNPVARMFYSKKDVSKRYLKTLILYILNFFNLDLFFRKRIAKPVTEFEATPGKDFQLHGACMMFGEQYIGKYDGLYPGTFMYGEEDFLRYRVEKDGLVLRYLENLTVWHKEGASTKSIYKKDRKKRAFFYKWSLNSLRQLKKLMSA